MSPVVLYVLAGLGLIVVHALLILAAQSLAVLAGRAGASGYRLWRRTLDAASNRKAGA